MLGFQDTLISFHTFLPHRRNGNVQLSEDTNINENDHMVHVCYWYMWENEMSAQWYELFITYLLVYLLVFQVFKVSTLFTKDQSLNQHRKPTDRDPRLVLDTVAKCIPVWYIISTDKQDINKHNRWYCDDWGYFPVRRKQINVVFLLSLLKKIGSVRICFYFIRFFYKHYR